MTSEIFKTDIP